MWPETNGPVDLSLFPNIKTQGFPNGPIGNGRKDDHQKHDAPSIDGSDQSQFPASDSSKPWETGTLPRYASCFNNPVRACGQDDYPEFELPFKLPQVSWR